jgi:hypothetical protein
MKQINLGLNLGTKRTRKREFLDEMDRVVPWDALVALIAPFAPEGKTGRPPFAVQAMLRIHFLHVWTRRLLQAQFGDSEWSAYMYPARLLGKPCASPQPR